MRVFGFRSAWVAGLAVVIVGGGSGCKDEQLVHPDARAAYDALVAEPVSQPLARVNGRDLSAAEFEAFWADHAELSRDDALQGWLEQEVLAQHGEGAVLQDDGALAYARKQGMVRVLLREEVERKVKLGDEKVDARLEKVREHVRAQMTQPAGVRVSHLLVHVPKERVAEGAKAGDKPEKISEAEREVLFEEAHEWAMKIRESLGDSASLDDLYAAEVRFAGEVGSELALAVNAHLSLAVPALEASEVKKPQPSKIPEGWLSVVKEFAVGAAAMQGSAVGTISAPVRSDFGWHLIRFEKDFPLVVADEREVEERARVETIRGERARRFGELSGDLVEKSTVNLFPQVIGQQGQIHGQ